MTYMQYTEFLNNNIEVVSEEDISKFESQECSLYDSYQDWGDEIETEDEFIRGIERHKKDDFFSTDKLYNYLVKIYPDNFDTEIYLYRQRILNEIKKHIILLLEEKDKLFIGIGHRFFFTYLREWVGTERNGHYANNHYLVKTECLSCNKQDCFLRSNRKPYLNIKIHVRKFKEKYHTFSPKESFKSDGDGAILELEDVPISVLINSEYCLRKKISEMN